MDFSGLASGKSFGKSHGHRHIVYAWSVRQLFRPGLKHTTEVSVWYGGTILDDGVIETIRLFLHTSNFVWSPDIFKSSCFELSRSVGRLFAKRITAWSCSYQGHVTQKHIYCVLVLFDVTLDIGATINHVTKTLPSRVARNNKTQIRCSNSSTATASNEACSGIHLLLGSHGASVKLLEM